MNHFTKIALCTIAFCGQIYAGATNFTPSEAALNQQIQTQMKAMQAQQQQQIATLNAQLQAQIQKVQKSLEQEMQTANMQLQGQMKQMQTQLQQQITQVNAQVNKAH